MPARRKRAIWLVALALTGLFTGLLLGASGAQETTSSSADGGDAAQVSVPAAQTDLVRSNAITTEDPGVPTTSVPTATAQDLRPKTTTVVTLDNGVSTTETKPVGPPPAPASGLAVASASLQAIGPKRKEAAASCRAHPPAVSSLLSVGSTIPGEDPERRSPTLLLLGVGLLALAVMSVAIFTRRGVDKTKPATPQTPLEVASICVAIIAGIGTLAANYLGAGVKEHPPPAVSMTVREVHSRVAHGAYVDKMSGQTTAGLKANSDAALDRREIGNVVWLELRFTGYRRRAVQLQWALFHAGRGQPLIPHTEHVARIPIDDSGDVHSEFRPIWVGSPRIRRFRAEFRVLDHGQVRQIASTGPMKGIPYRYAC